MFGYRVNPILGVYEFHNGIDIAIYEGTEVIAVKSGVVTEVRYSDTFGNLVMYKTNTGYEIMYAHLKKVYVELGDKIQQGDVIALSGNTGLSTAPHLHYSIWKNEELVNPINYLYLPYTIIVYEELQKREAF